jgi:hypothetical protein
VVEQAPDLLGVERVGRLAHDVEELVPEALFRVVRELLEQDGRDVDRHGNVGVLPRQEAHHLIMSSGMQERPGIAIPPQVRFPVGGLVHVPEQGDLHRIAPRSRVDFMNADPGFIGSSALRLERGAG